MTSEAVVKKTSKHYSRSHEPIAWSLFGAGGMVVAFLTPVLIILTGLVLPLGLVGESVLSFDRAVGFAQAWWGKLFILSVIALQLYHAAHRTYHGLHDIHLAGPPALMLTIFYGGATAVSCIVLACLLRIGFL